MCEGAGSREGVAALEERLRPSCLDGTPDQPWCRGSARGNAGSSSEVLRSE